MNPTSPSEWEEQYRSRAGRVQARPHGVQLSAQPSTPVPRRPLPVCLLCRLQTTSSLCQPSSSRRASPSSQQLWSAGFLCAWPALRYGIGYQTVWEIRPSAETTSSVQARRFYFQLSHSGHERHADWPRAATAFLVAECDLDENAEEASKRSDRAVSERRENN